MLFLRNNPLLRVVPSLRDSKKFFKIYKTIFINFLKGLAEIYSKGIIIGDLSPYNLIIDPETYSLKFIDFENAGKLGCDMAGPLHTPGFSKSQVAEKELSYKDSMYSLGTIMTYLLFPTNVLGLLRSDYYSTIVNQFIDDLGWSPKVYTAIKKSFEGSITINDLSLLLNKAEKEITTSSYDDYVDKKEVIKIVNQLGKFILNNYDTSRIDRLFPADPYLYRTNALSFGFGALGVMYSLKKCNIKLPRDMTLWVEKRIKYINKSDYAPNFLTGLAGISYALWELGYKEYGEKLIIAANRHDLLTKHHSLYYGIAGIGLINLFFFHKTKRNLFLDEAVIMGNYLLESVVNDNRKWFWNGDNNNNITIGFGYGQSGVALFLLRLYQITGDDKYLSMGKKTLSTDISFCKNIEKNVLSFPGSSVNPTLEPYIEEGSGGILKVILRYGNYITYNNLSNTINDIHRKYSVYPGLIFGVGSFIDVLIDAYLYLNETKYLKMAQRPIKGLSDFYLLKYQDSYAVPGDGLYKISCDYATGVAGIMRVLHRYVCPNYSDYLLDEVEI